jgi:hypothetical protein
MESKAKSKSTRGTISILKQITLDPILLKSATKKSQEPTTNQPSLNVDLERKRASHIMHYLMERKQEHDYADPFELLKNMTDVINVYEPR